VIVSDLSPKGLNERLVGTGLGLHVGPFVVRVRTSIPSIERGIATLYSAFPVASESEFVDFWLEFSPVRGLRQLVRPQVQFSFDGLRPFVPLPLNHAFPMFEWAMNWCIAKHVHQYLIIHAAVIERDGMAVIMPGAPGAGKSTLCAVLVNRGWRLLTDELAMIVERDGTLMPIPRPVSLKNESIEIVRNYAPGAVFGELFLDTKKGTVAHMKPADDSVRRAKERPHPAWLIMPRYIPGSPATLRPASKAQFCLQMANNSFNYNILDEQGFNMLADLVERCDCYDFYYSDLNQAIQVFDNLRRPDNNASHPE
jgi:hypothetical protein